MTTFYQILNVTNQATADQITQAYLAARQPYLPPDEENNTTTLILADANYNASVLNRIDVAYETLHDPAKRANYDELEKFLAACGPYVNVIYSLIEYDFTATLLNALTADYLPQLMNTVALAIAARSLYQGAEEMPFFRWLINAVMWRLEEYHPLSLVPMPRHEVKPYVQAQIDNEFSKTYVGKINHGLLHATLDDVKAAPQTLVTYVKAATPEVIDTSMKKWNAAPPLAQSALLYFALSTAIINIFDMDMYDQEAVNDAVSPAIYFTLADYAVRKLSEKFTQSRLGLFSGVTKGVCAAAKYTKDAVSDFVQPHRHNA